MPCDREQGYLMPPSLQEWLPEGDLAWFILDVVGQLDLKEFYGRPIVKTAGAPRPTIPG